MRSLPLTDKGAPGGRPRVSRAPANAFATWLASCGMTATVIAGKLERLLGRPVSVSAIYNARNGYYKPGRALANAIAELSTKSRRTAVPVSSWEEADGRPRTKPARVNGGGG